VPGLLAAYLTRRQMFRSRSLAGLDAVQLLFQFEADWPDRLAPMTAEWKELPLQSVREFHLYQDEMARFLREIEPAEVQRLCSPEASRHGRVSPATDSPGIWKKSATRQQKSGRMSSRVISSSGPST
jgi:hypothetical protein